MKILLVGVGGVGEAIAAISKPRPWLELMVLADYNKERCLEVQAKLGDNEQIPGRMGGCEQEGTDRRPGEKIQGRPDHERLRSVFQCSDIRCCLRLRV